MPSRLRDPRWAALAVVVAVLVVTTSAYGVAVVAEGDRIDAVAAPVTTTTTTSPPTTATTAAAETTTTAPVTTTTPPAAAADGVLVRGERGEEVAAVQRRLGELRFDPGPADGVFGAGTLYAVQAFQKLAGMAPDGKVGPEVQAALADPPPPAPLVPGGEPNRVEVDKARQLLFLYVDGDLRLISHVSTGSGDEYCVEGECGNKAITPEGGFRFIWRRTGWRESRLGKLYNPVYFTRSGVAIHGSTSVPTYPASHGCVRIPMHIAEYFPGLVKTGDAVYVLAGPGSPAGTPPPRSEPPPPPPPDRPTTPDSTTTTAPPATTTSTTSTTAPDGSASTSIPLDQ